MWIHKKPIFLLEAQGAFPQAMIFSSLPDLLELSPGNYCKSIHPTSSDRMKVIPLFPG